MGSGAPLLLAGLGGILLLNTLLGGKGKRKGRGGGIRKLQRRHAEERSAMAEKQAVELAHARARR